MSKEFTMSQYRSKEDLYKAKAEYYESRFIKLVDMVKGKRGWIRPSEALLQYALMCRFEEVYGVASGCYELDDLQEKVDALEVDGELPMCYYHLKRYIKEFKELEDAA